jgi:outer membrane immunogenic protein
MTNKFIQSGLVAGIMAGLVAAPAMAGGFAEPIATPPVAAPVIVAQPAPMMSADWTGFYAGAQLGYGQLKSDAIADEPKDLLYGVHAGYLYDLGSVVLGAELDYDMTNIGFAAPAVDLDSVARFKLRAGYDAGAFQPYLTAGVAQATVSGALDGTSDGRFAGLGVDYQLSDSFRIGGEVLAHQFDNLVDSGVDVDATTLTLRASYNF